jgi:SAM-dependent methyltransferase
MDEIKGPIEFSDYDSYLRVEWDKFASNPARCRASLAAAHGMEVKHVLDVGCGAGQELLPFVTQKSAIGVGIDVASSVGRVGREMYAANAPSARVNFLRGTAELLPFPSDSFDVVICRLALPYPITSVPSPKSHASFVPGSISQLAPANPPRLRLPISTLVS